jgi:predicted transcriptional regulator
MGGFLENLTSGSYGQTEGTPSAQSQQAINSFKQTTSSYDASAKANIQTLLNKIESFISSNRGTINAQISQLEKSQRIIEQELKQFQDDDTASQLSKLSLPSSVLDASYVAYAEYYSDMVELKYRLSIISYRKSFLQEQLSVYDAQMKIVQLYIQSLE